MRKIVVILILLIYSSATIGATIHLHYCMDEYVGWSLWHGKENKECGKCGMKESKEDCCKDEHKQVKLKSEHQKADNTYKIQFIDIPAVISPASINWSGVIHASTSPPISTAPPNSTGPALYILHCVFTI